MFGQGLLFWYEMFAIIYSCFRASIPLTMIIFSIKALTPHLLTFVVRCPSGYSYLPGDARGSGMYGVIGANLSQCAANCTADPKCNSFESNGTLCNLNEERLPNQTPYYDYLFCSKMGTFERRQLITKIY